MADTLTSIGDYGNMASSTASTAGSATKDLQYKAGNLLKSFIPQATLAGQVKSALPSMQAPMPATGLLKAKPQVLPHAATPGALPRAKPQMLPKTAPRPALAVRR